MRHSGHHIVAHHPGPLADLLIFREIGNNAWGDADDRALPDGWHILDVRHGLGDDRDWLADLVRATRAPALIISVFDGTLATIRGLEPGPHATPWSARLHSAAAPARYPTPKHRHLHGGLPPLWMISDALLSGPPAADALAAWSAATNGAPDRAALTALLIEEPELFTADVVLRLLDTLGLSAHVEPAPYPHEASSWDDPAKLEKSVSALQPGRYRALDCTEHRNCYALVRMRPQGDYVLEYREQSPEVLHQTVTASLEAVITALKSWADGEVRWRDDFDWTPISPAPR